MDPLLTARSKRLRGHIRFQRDVDQEHRRMQEARESLEKAVGTLMDVRLTRQARVSNDVTFLATLTLPGQTFVAAGRHAHVETAAAAFRALVQKFTDLISDGMLSRQFPESEYTRVEGP